MDNNLNQIYIKFLSTPAPDFHGRVVNPIASATLKAMIEHNDQFNQADLARSLVSKHIASDKKVKYWSDPHFFHKNIIKYCDRPFKSEQHMNMMMIDYYSKEVSDDDLVIWGGDISFGKKEDTRALLRNLPGKKILIMGNHDFLKKKNFIDLGIFDATVMSLDFNQEIAGEIWNIWVTHYPINTTWVPKNTINVHGHIHSYTAGLKNLNISVEHTNYRPQIIDDRMLELRKIILSGAPNVDNSNTNQKMRMDI